MKVVQYVAPLSVHKPQVIPTFDTEELQYLQYFIDRTGPDLAGVHDPEIWLRYTTHIAFNEPSIKHGLLAVAAVHQLFKASQTLSQQQKINEYALRQYVKSIRCVESIMSGGASPYPDTVLVACMLFCAFESMSYHIGSAIMHAGSGLNILAERGNSRRLSAPTKIPPGQLLPLYIRLDTQSLELGETSNAVSKGNNSSIWDDVTDEQTVPDAYNQTGASRAYVLRKSKPGQLDSHTSIFGEVVSFTSVADAHRQFDLILNAIFHGMYGIDRRSRSRSGERDQRKSLLDDVDRYKRWCATFDHTVQIGVTSEDLPKCILMQVWRLLVNINLQVDLGHGEMDFDRFTSEFESIVELANCFVLIQAPGPHTKLTTDNGPPDHLELMAPKDRNLNVHRAAMDQNGLKGGYLGIHPRHTPFILGDAIDSSNLQATTALLVDDARRIINAKRPKFHPSEGDVNLPSDLVPSFSLSPGIVSPVFVAISRCRDSNVRRRALLLMQRCKRREGLWDSALAARLGAMVIQIEEQRARELNLIRALSWCECAPTSTNVGMMPNEARVRMIKPTWLPDRTTVERLYFGWGKLNDEEDSIEEVWVEEVLRW